VGANISGALRKPVPTLRFVGERPLERRGTVSHGRIVKLLVGQGHGFIRVDDGREVFFHRADLREGTSINDFAVGHTVTFDLLEDPVSGARAARVRRRRGHR
jgi:cold shock CspA family protein